MCTAFLRGPAKYEVLPEFTCKNRISHTLMFSILYIAILLPFFHQLEGCSRCLMLLRVFKLQKM